MTIREPNEIEVQRINRLGRLFFKIGQLPDGTMKDDLSKVDIELTKAWQVIDTVNATLEAYSLDTTATDDSGAAELVRIRDNAERLIERTFFDVEKILDAQ